MIPKMFTQSLKSCSIVDSGKELCSLVFSRLPSSPLPKQGGGGGLGLLCCVRSVSTWYLWAQHSLVAFTLGGKTSANLSKSLETVISALSSRKWASTASRSCSKPPKKQLSFLVLEKQFFVRISLLASFIVDIFSSFSLVLAAIFCFRWLMVSWRKGMGICRMISSEWVLDLNSVAAWEHRVSSRPPSQHLLKTWQSVIEAWEWG